MAQPEQFAVLTIDDDTRIRDLLNALQPMSVSPLIARQIPIREGEKVTGEERLLNVDERLKLDYRAVSRKPLKGALGRRER